eukprot:COSAG06_NODE_2046_length_7748_cov_7.658779_11_plen_35_part_00
MWAPHFNGYVRACVCPQVLDDHSLFEIMEDYAKK